MMHSSNILELNEFETIAALIFWSLEIKHQMHSICNFHYNLLCLKFSIKLHLCTTDHNSENAKDSSTQESFVSQHPLVQLGSLVNNLASSASALLVEQVTLLITCQNFPFFMYYN